MLCYPYWGHSERGIIPMKNSDMKVIAIILSIALLITFVASNAVSVVSVVTLLKGGNTVSADGTQGDGSAVSGDSGSGVVSSGVSGGATVSDGSMGSTVSGGSTGGATVSGGTTGGTASTGGSTGGSTAGGSTAGGSAAGGTASGNAGGAAASTDAVIADPLAFYQKAAGDIHTKGTAGYNKISWQRPIKIEGLGFLDSIITPIIEGFMTTEDEAKVKENAKGSDDAKNRMPESNCSKSYVKSATAEKLANGNYKVVIVMNECVNPSYEDADGLVRMSKEFLDYKDVEKEAKDISIVKSLDGTITYKDYTITAEMTQDGKFVSITHCGVGYIKANLNGSIDASGELEFNAKYTDFKY